MKNAARFTSTLHITITITITIQLSRPSRMAPADTLRPEGIARAISSLPTALFVGDVSGPLNAEASALVEKLDPKLSEIQGDIDATLELCHIGNEPSAGKWKDNIQTMRSGVRSIQAMTASLLNGTYVAPRALERLHREASLSSLARSVGASRTKGQPARDQEFVLEL